ncbi:MAG TPA: lectin-like protein [Polyangiaceae bacterium]|nr:lectin-like protein [Polyangiaceae bacterium]
MLLRLLPAARLILFGCGFATFGSACLDWSKLENGACGDGFVGREEACDDGNRISGDGCSDSCRLEPVTCGDGRKAPNEDCDDANSSNDDDCVEGCKQARCGDGHLWDIEEQCDDGNQQDGDGCSMVCSIETTTSGPTCGNGEIDDDEACDDGNVADSDSCLHGCSWATCGDGRVRSGVEECDPGTVDAAPQCTRGCMMCGGMSGSYFRGGNAHCYTLHLDAVTAPQARSNCQAEGGDLWTVTSEGEGNDVIEKLGLGERVWLGLLTNKTGYSWASGEGTKFTNFAAGEPRDTALRCVVLDATSDSRAWSSEACSVKLGYVCERAPALISPADHHAYRLHTASVSAAAARDRCVSDGGHLAALETDAERTFVGKNTGVVAWVDATKSDDQFRWSNGDLVDRALFAAGQPDGMGNEGCLLFNPGDKYADAPCDEVHAFICEFD